MEFGDAEDMPRADGEYFRALIEGVCSAHAELDTRLRRAPTASRACSIRSSTRVLLMRPVRAAPRGPMCRFASCINEAVGLARRFGATDGHKFVNAVLDRARARAAAARTLKASERAWRCRNLRSSTATSATAARSARDVVLGVGDDAALLECPPGAELVAATDTLVAGRALPARLAGAPRSAIARSRSI